MSRPKLFRHKQHVAVVGLYRSGKSVFITSLLNHLKHHSPASLKLGNGNVQITIDTERPLANGIAEFPYDEIRSYAHKKWPDKTKACYQFRCTYFRSDWSWSKGELLLLDVPGERLADIPIASLSYSHWSDWLLEKVFKSVEYRNHCEEFMRLCCTLDADPSALVDEYRKLMSSLYREYRPVITPSTFLLTETGKFTGAQLMKGDLTSSFSGVSTDTQFVPLPPEVRKKRPDLAASFEAYYRLYKSKVASPLLSMLRRCNQLVVLIDVTTLLAANTGMFNGNKILVDQLLEFLSPGSGFFGLTLNALRSGLTGGHWRRSGITRVAVVATKADKVHKSQRRKLTDLLKGMVGTSIRRLMHSKLQLDCEYFYCAAVRCTKSLEDGKLRGRLSTSGEDGAYSVSELPKQWPASWKETDFRFPDVCPVFPENVAVAPQHQNLEQVVAFLLKK